MAERITKKICLRITRWNHLNDIHRSNHIFLDDFMRKIYLASSWKNSEKIRSLAIILRKNGHQVFDFTDDSGRQNGLDTYVFNARKLFGNSFYEMNHKEFLAKSETKRAFLSDKAGIDWCDTLILVLPCGNSSHIEAGYAKGKRKELIIYGNLPKGSFDTMYGFSEEIFFEDELDHLIEHLLIPVECTLFFDYW